MMTNEEKRVSVYTESGVCTVPREVTSDTPIESLNLNWREQELPERERTKHVHRLHPYLGKFIPQLVEIFLRKYFVPGQTVLDPFCGSGTTLVQANELGINSVGYDISAFNVLLCRAKIAHYDLSLVNREVQDILEKARCVTQAHSPQLSLLDDALPLPELSHSDTQYLKEWYAPQALQELLMYRHYLDTEDYHYKDLLSVILARSARSARLTTHFDLDFPKCPQIEPYWCYKHSRMCEPTTEAFKFLKRYSLDTITRLREFAAVRTDARGEVSHADSRFASFPPIDGVITSPPYVGLIDYHEQHAYAFHLLGLKDNREAEIGAAAKGSAQRAKEQYQNYITQVFCAAVERMPSGGRIIVVANDKFHLYDPMAELLGMEVEGVVQRHVNRRTGRRSGEYYESIFIWRKR